MAELLAQDALVKAVAGIMKHDEVDAAIHGDIHPLHAAEFRVVGHRANRAVFRLENFDLDLGVIRQKRPAPAAGAEGRNRGQGQQGRVERKDRSADGKIVGCRTGRSRSP